MLKIVAIHSFRGGTGKSNITANIATVLARWGHRVGVMDTDLQSPGIHILFGVDQETLAYTLNDYLWHGCEIHNAAYDVTPEAIAQAGRPAFYEQNANAIVDRIIPMLRPKDVVVVFSNGGFDDIHKKLLARLSA